MHVYEPNIVDSGELGNLKLVRTKEIYQNGSKNTEKKTHGYS